MEILYFVFVLCIIYVALFAISEADIHTLLAKVSLPYTYFRAATYLHQAKLMPIRYQVKLTIRKRTLSKNSDSIQFL